ncbi:hypothetical protein ACHHYP_00664 [Achlya hypogyna]|uniref:Progesterone-induced-blocking factor 1 n=1 Tax=Achlya hypogyna TaxID=1202772 RepID=A0A1V9ZU34_ACHHY|nr:hypothetical protein ACHHYP_00664 [Achlya hypogyna]
MSARAKTKAPRSVDSRADNDDGELDVEVDSSGSVPSSSSEKVRRLVSQLGLRKEGNTSGSSHGDDSSSLSLPHSFDNTPASTPAASPAPSRNVAQSFDLALRNLPPRSGQPKRTDDTMRKFFEIQVDKVRAQLSLALEEKKQAQAALSTERRTFQDTIASLQIRVKNEMSQLKTEKAAVETQLHIMEHRLKAEKHQFYDLRVPAALAKELQRQSHDALTLVEFVQMKAFELVEPHVAAQDAAALEIARLKEVTTGLQAKADASAEDAHRLQRKCDVQARELELSEATRLELERQVKQLHAHVQELNALRASAPAAASPLVTAALEAQVRELQAQLEAARQAREASKSEKEQLEQRVALLVVDKEYLSKAHDRQDETIKQLQDDLQSAQASVRRLEHSKETFLAQVEQAREEAKTLFEHRMHVELGKLQDAAKNEMDALRESGKTLFERENRLLRDARADALAQAEATNQKLASLQRAYEDKVLELTRLDAQFTTGVADVRNELKIKHFELAQLSRNYEDKVQLLHQAHLEVDMLKQKASGYLGPPASVDVHKSEFQRLETASAKEIAALRLEVASERDKLKAYEALEVDMDQAVLQAGLLPETSDATAATFALIPTAPKRRFQQSVALAQKVVQCELTIQSQARQLEQLQSQHDQVVRELEHAQTQLAHVHQPQQYLIEKLRRLQAELSEREAACQGLQTALHEHQARANELLQTKIALQGQLQQLLGRRHELDTLKAMVLQTQQSLARAAAPVAATTPPPTTQATIGSVPKWYQKLRPAPVPPPSP